VSTNEVPSTPVTVCFAAPGGESAFTKILPHKPIAVGDDSGAGETCCGFSSTSTRARSLFGCGECSSSIADSGGDGISSRPEVLREVLWSGSSERLSDSAFFCEEF
jgi:hypothetical protein